MATPEIYVRTGYRTFGPGQERALEAALAENARDTLVDDVVRVEDLQLGGDGRTRDGYGYSATGLKQVCQVACPWLFSAMVDVAGVGRHPDSPREEFSYLEAARLFNRVVTLRFDGRFAHKQRLLRNVREKRIEGVLGPRYALIPNDEIHERAGEVAAGGDRPSSFHSATLSGRHLTLRYLQDAPLFAVDGFAPDGPDAFHGGLHVVNSEVGGESTVRVALLLRRAADGGTSLSPWLGGRRVHTGKDLGQRIARTFAAAQDARQDPEALRRRVIGLHHARLGAAAADDDDLQDRLKALARILVENDVPRGVASKAVLAALTVGAYGSHGHPGALPAREDMVRRTAFDLYAALTAGARGLFATAAEATEQAADALLMGRFRAFVPAASGDNRAPRG